MKKILKEIKTKKDYYVDGTLLIKLIGNIYKIDEILEHLDDMGYLNENGKKLRTDFWKEWIKEDL